MDEKRDDMKKYLYYFLGMNILVLGITCNTLSNLDLQNGFDGNGKLQGCGVLVRGDTFHKQDLIFLESADDNIGVADINGKYHKRTSCFEFIRYYSTNAGKLQAEHLTSSVGDAIINQKQCRTSPSVGSGRRCTNPIETEV